MAAQPDPLLGENPVDTELVRGDRAEHRNRQPGGPRVQPIAACEADAQDRRQVQAGGQYLEAAGLAHGDQRTPIDVGVLHQCGVRHQLDVSEQCDSRRRLAGRLRRRSAEALSGLDGEQVGAEPVDLRDQPACDEAGQSEAPTMGCSADRDPERRQRGAKRSWRAARRSPTRARPATPSRPSGGRSSHPPPHASVETRPVRPAHEIWRGNLSARLCRG